MYHLIFYIHSPHFYLQTSSLHTPYSIDGQSTHLSIDRVPSSTIITLDLPPSEDCRLVEWAQMTYKNIHHVFPPCGQTSTSTKQPSIRVPNLCSINLILILWQVIHCHHPLHVSDGSIRSGTHYLIGYTMRYRILWEVIINNSRYGIPKIWVVSWSGGEYWILRR